MPSRDERYMLAALEAARSVAGHTGDNPPVGCVVVQGERVVGRGATQPPGGCHAEVMAVRAAEAAGASIAGAELYVILEPCSFTGRTPPCSRLLVQKRPRRVVVGVRDPHPFVRGQGIAELNAAGIEVVEGVLTGPIREFLAGWLRRFDAGAAGGPP
ncbi:MAG TPA: deaminase [bacterium]|jgi:diaminohydroxyphosphoribosylaminopyrimidine deaminase/5-amino-6-(5-phosphoribosylamino)uracil reductase